MKQLLNQTELRQLREIEILFNEKSWMKISTLSEMLDCSVRVLKDDIAHFRNNWEEFSIDTSNNGVRLVMHNNTGLKTIYQRFLAQSISFNLLETIFFNTQLSISDLAEALYVSTSTVYRTIEQINAHLLDYQFQIETNPCRVEGSEDEIRYFFYNYFHEKYSNLQWSFYPIEEATLNQFLHFFIEFAQMKADFAYYNIFKVVSVVNLIRFKQGYYVDTSDIQINFDEIIPDLTAFTEVFHKFEAANEVTVNNLLIQQIFTPYIREEFSLNFDRLMKKTKTSLKFSKEIQFLEKLLDDLAKKHQISLANKEDVILNVHNASHLEYNEPRSGFILHNHNYNFMLNVKNDFPHFYNDLYKGAQDYRVLMRKPLTSSGIVFIMYMIFTSWENLLPELRRKFEKIHILVISDRHVSHSNTIKDLIEYEFHEQIHVDVYEAIKLDKDILSELDYDIIVGNFPLPKLNNQRTVYVENLPTYYDIVKIRETVNEIILERLAQ